MRFTIIVFLYATKKGLLALQSFEQKVLPLLEKHGGRLDAAFTPNPETTSVDDRPDEIHVLSFPSEAAFVAYREDPKLLALSEERTKAIRNTQFIAGNAVTSYA